MLGEITGEGCGLILELGAQVVMCLLALLPPLGRRLLEYAGQRLQFRGQASDGIGAVLFFGRQAPRHRVHFFSNVLLQRGESFLEVVAQLGCFCQQLSFEFGEPALMITYLGAEQNVADLVEVGAGCMLLGQHGFRFCVGETAARGSFRTSGAIKIRLPAHDGVSLVAIVLSRKGPRLACCAGGNKSGLVPAAWMCRARRVINGSGLRMDSVVVPHVEGTGYPPHRLVIVKGSPD